MTADPPPVRRIRFVPDERALPEPDPDCPAPFDGESFGEFTWHRGDSTGPVLARLALARHPWWRLSGCCWMVSTLVAGEMLLERADRIGLDDVARTIARDALDAGWAWVAGEADWDQLLAPCYRIMAPWNYRDDDLPGHTLIGCSVFNAVEPGAYYAPAAHSLGVGVAIEGPGFVDRWWRTVRATLAVRDVRHVAFDNLAMHRLIGRTPLAQVLVKGRKEHGLAHAAWLADPTLVEPLWQVVTTARGRKLPTMALRALIRIGDPSIVPDMEARLRDKLGRTAPSEVETTMVHGLDLLDGRAGVEALRRLLADGGRTADAVRECLQNPAAPLSDAARDALAAE